MELTAESDGGGEIGIMSAMKTLKNINATANFGKFLWVMVRLWFNNFKFN